MAPDRAPPAHRRLDGQMVAGKTLLDLPVGPALTSVRRGGSMRLMIAAVILGIAAVGCSDPAAQQPAARGDAARATGALPDGWKARLDDVAAKPDAVRVAAEGKASLTFTSGPAGIYYKPDMK